MRELCGTAAEYLGCHTLRHELESGGDEFRFESGRFNIFAPKNKGSQEKHIYRPMA